MDLRQRRNSILMLPWLAYGHISPFLELAKALSKRDFHIYLCSTPVNLNSIKQNLTSKTSISIQLIELHLPPLPDLPPHYHTTNGLPPHLMATLKQAFDMGNPNFSTILKTLKPDLLIYDFLQPWAPLLALSNNIPAILFLSPGAAASSYLLHLQMNPSSKFPFSAIYLRKYEYTKMANMAEKTANNIKDADRYLECLKRSSNIVLIKSFREIEDKYIDYLSDLGDKKFMAVGPLVQEVFVDDEVGDANEIIKWINTKDPFSTVFVSFGSEYFLSTEDMEQVAHGLELSMVNFIWVVRFPVGDGKKKNTVGEALPRGFLERIRERGMVIEGWAPQGRILGHSSVGGFVSHCGWSSVMEGMKFGVPIIAMPMHLDQPLNARLVEEVGVGEEVVRDMDGRLERGEIARVIRKVVVDKTGEKLRRKARDLSEKIRRKGQEEVDGMVEMLAKLCNNSVR